MFYIHSFLSIIFVIISVSSVIRFYMGWKNKLVFTKYDNWLAKALLITLYLQMLMGVYLFYTKLSGTIVIQNNSLENRFWPVEHFFVMFFSILTAQLGYVYAKNLKNSEKKFKTLIIYYSISLVLVIFSLSMILLQGGGTLIIFQFVISVSVKRKSLSYFMRKSQYRTNSLLIKGLFIFELYCRLSFTKKIEVLISENNKK